MSKKIKFIHQIYDAKYTSTKELKIPIHLNLRYQYNVDKIIMEYYEKCVVVSATCPRIKDKLAIKCIPIQKAGSDGKEADIMMKLNHPNIIRFIDDFIYPEKNPRFYAIVMNKAVSDLYDYMEFHKTPFEERFIYQIMKQSLSAINYLHRLRICHRDLKLSNILIMKETRQGVDIAIADFGLSENFTSDSFCSTCTGSLQYAAPELLEVVDNELDFKEKNSVCLYFF